MIKYDFSDRIALVAGGTRGIGAAICRHLLEANATVVALYSSNAEAAKIFSDSLEPDERTRFAAYQCNIADYAAVEALFHQLDTMYDRLDIVINSAGIRKDGVLAMMPQENWNAVLETNLGGTFNLFKLGVQRMLRKRYGRLIAVSSIAGSMGIEGQSNYSASKAGQSALVKSFAKEIARRGITANCIAPGFIDTAFISNLSEELKETYRKSIPCARFGTPDEVANAALFLASEEASYINGTTLNITGAL